MAWDDSFAAPEADFGAAPIGHRNHFGSETGGNEPCVSRSLLRLIEDSTGGEHDFFEAGANRELVVLGEILDEKIIHSCWPIAFPALQDKDLAAEFPAKVFARLKETQGIRFADSTNFCRIFMFAIRQICSVLDRPYCPHSAIVCMFPFHIF